MWAKRALSQSVSWREKSKKKTSKGTDSGKWEGKLTGSRDSTPAKGKKKQPTHLVDEVSGEEGVYAATMYHIHGQSKPKAFAVTVELCGEPHKLEIQSNLDYPDIDYPDFSIIRTFSLVPFFS